VVFLKLRGLR